jgi:cytochrome c oxidase assembly factor CtaG
MSRFRILKLSPAATLAVAPVAAWAHGGEHADRTGWQAEPLALGLLALSMSLWTLGYLRMSRPARAAIAPFPRSFAYWTAVVTLVLALFSPLDARADVSFAWHMAQHLLLMLVAAPLLAVSNIHLIALFAVPLGPRRRIGRAVNAVPGVRSGASSRLAPYLAALAVMLGLWLWHAPGMYDRALAAPALHTAEHLTFLFTSAVFWRMVSTAGNRRLDRASVILLVTLIGLQGNLMAALITLAPHPIYAHYAERGLADQQLAGLMMWVPAGIVYLASTAWAILRLVQPRGDRANHEVVPRTPLHRT